MTRRVTFTPLAGREFAEAIGWYEARSIRIRNSFIAEIARLRDRIADNPHQYARLHGDARRAFVHGFPYMLIYRVGGDAGARAWVLPHESRSPWMAPAGIELNPQSTAPMCGSSRRRPALSMP